MKTLIFGAGPLGSLYACLLHKAGKDITILARNEHYTNLKENGIVLVNEFTQQKIVEKVPLVDSLSQKDSYDLVIVLMRKNSIKNVLPLLSKNKKILNILFMGNNTLGFDEYLQYLPREKVLFGFPGGGGSRIDHIVHYIDSEKPHGKRMPITIGEIDGEMIERTKQIQKLFKESNVPVNYVENIDSWLKYHAAFIIPLAGALLKCGDNYNLAENKETLRTYIRAVREAGNVLGSLGHKNQFPLKIKSFSWNPEWLTASILKQVFNTRFAEIAMTLHVRAARDEMVALGNDFKTLIDQTSIKTSHLNELIDCISST